MGRRGIILQFFRTQAFSQYVFSEPRRGKGKYSVKHVGVVATTPDWLCSTDPKRRTALNTYGVKD